ncbi:Glutathione S-transferase [Granulibacter bethesdensis]|uniref:Glutathione S-transferase n=1 Tax=Granulibacter bethesdensis TaxID=364410 RepID=A0AAN0VF11_9PROT|nr:glutathione S-transferase family protein [Granulibacter bethesdensis]AHJ62221.1 Glutathione S-transferase [Granulibacter bethesdensis]
MKLFYSTLSPFARKVIACAIAREVDQQITLIPTSPHASPPELLAANPLSKIPTLLTSDGLAIYDSPVICEYLDSIPDGGMKLFPRPESPARWVVLRQQALADGIMDAAVLRRGEETRPGEEARDAVIERQRQAVLRGLDFLETALPHSLLDIGSISVACALGYLDLRFSHEDWRSDHPRLAQWFETISQEPALARSVPKPA